MCAHPLGALSANGVHLLRAQGCALRAGQLTEGCGAASGVPGSSARTASGLTTALASCSQPVHGMQQSGDVLGHVDSTKAGLAELSAGRGLSPQCRQEEGQRARAGLRCGLRLGTESSLSTK